MAALALLSACAAPPPPPAAAPTPAPEQADTALLRKLQEAVAGFEGEVGIYARHLPSGATAALRADETFPTASLIKVPLLIALHDRAARGELDLHAPQLYADSLRRTDGDDLVARFRDGEKVDAAKLAFLMISLSDNTASVWIQQLVGGGAAVNRWLEANGFAQTRVNSRTPGREAEQRQWGWGQTTPREMAELLVRIRQGAAVSPAASAEMYRTLTRSYWDDEALSALPPTVQAASKQGAVSRSRSEVLLVNAPGGDYVLSVITRNQKDTSWEADNAGFVLLRRVSAIVYRHFAPDVAAAG